MPNDTTNVLLELRPSALLGLFDQVGIILNEQEQEDFKRGIWAFANINADLLNWSLLGKEDFAEQAPRRFTQIWHSFVKRNPEFIALVNRLKQAMYESVALAETPSAGEA